MKQIDVIEKENLVEEDYIEQEHFQIPEDYVDPCLDEEVNIVKTKATKLSIMLDAGHKSKYNQSPVCKDYYEGDMTFKLQGYLKAELESYGIKVGVTKTSASTDIPVYDRGAKAKGYDMFISLHSNACDTESVDYPVVIRGYNQASTDALALKLAKDIESKIGTRQAGKTWTRTHNGGEYYGVLRGAAAMGVKYRFIIEFGYHTNTKTVKWLSNNANLKQIAKSQAEIIAKHFNLVKETPATSTPTVDNNYVTSEVPFTVKITTDSLNVRKGPSTNDAIVTTVSKGQVYTITKLSDNKKWGYLKSGAGYISLHKDYVSKF